MATPQTRLILQNLRSTLSAITVVGGFKTTVATVDRVPEVRTKVPDSLMPWIGVTFLEDDIEALYTETYKVRQHVVLSVFVRGDTEDDMELARENLYDDIIAALNADPRRGDDGSGGVNASDTVVRGRRIGYPPSERNVGFMHIDVTVTYHRTTGST